jgi:hypothetical protein
MGLNWMQQLYPPPPTVAPKRMRVSHGQCPPSLAHQSHFIAGASGLLKHSHRAPGE